MIDAAGHSLQVDVPEAPIWLDADPTRLAQVVGNLLNNAVKYTPQGGRIAISLRREASQAVIAISDTGLGIPRDKQAEVFQLFAQVDHHLDRARGGLGIGLALVKQLVVMHGGTVEAYSAGPGEGSTFTVRLPLAARPAEPAPVAQASTKPDPVSRSLKVLVVDDNEAVAQTVGWMLEAIGHDYRLVYDGRSALQAAEDYRPDAILLDIGLPGMDGYEVCRALRRQEAFKKTAIIAQTGWGQERDKALASEAGFDHHIVKPVGLDRLEQLLADVDA
jgi:CheY-like chemotaxis protein/anti-sigma regulatory factor (Ser/Thr protein kinase)